MSWRDDMGPATFRGVEFFVDTSERDGGRRTVLHEYPLRDDPFVEDMGRHARLFPVEGYVLGPDYMAARDKLIAALEDEAGPGELVHPYHGTRSAICIRFRVRESTAEGGVARFSMEFGETPAQPASPTAAPAGEEEVEADADAAEEEASNAFLDAYNAVSSGVAELSAVVKSATDAMNEALGPIVKAAQDLAQLKHDIDNLVLNVGTMIRAPFKLLGALKNTIGSLASLSLLSGFGLDAILRASGFTPGASRPPATTPARQREQANYDALVWIIRTLGVIQAARFAAAATYDSHEAAAAARAAVCDQLDAQLDGASDAAFAALSQLRASIVRAVPGEASDLPRLMRYTPPATVPSLVLAQRLYGDVSREADLVTRNAVNRPGFVVGGVELEVLSSGA